jgi:hypothetical protein
MTTEPKGICPKCQKYVWADQKRTKDEYNIYRHVKCPRRQSGLVKQLTMMHADLEERDQKYRQQLEDGMRSYFNIPEDKRKNITEYGTYKNNMFLWDHDKLHSCFPRRKSLDYLMSISWC